MVRLRRRSQPIFARRRRWQPVASAIVWIVVVVLVAVFFVGTVAAILAEDASPNPGGSQHSGVTPTTHRSNGH
ncbi:MAG: hypothetical protein ACLGHT_02675 [Acidimicrobiia bacterium]